MSQHEEWTPETERAVYVAQAQAIVEALDQYEDTHPKGAPCFLGELDRMKRVFQS